jgi:alpha-tubulin suppressor-like RCC1 family protein
MTEATAIAVGDSHTCALLMKGKLRCWGGNEKGQLGTGDTVNRYIPVLLTLEPGQLALLYVMIFNLRLNKLRSVAEANLIT